ncbi:hypothetical protein C4565_01610 [Candidatus Parcubacteria bacterium]|nr:MAG: hypothetical protein C4565_01610 [Candidatus Parcubacteria bacterium]
MMQSSVFAVNDEPYCIWDFNLERQAQKFLEGIDPDYFEYVFNEHLAADDETRAVMAIKLSLHHATETMFSMIGAYVQAPDCPQAWLAKCSNSTLRKVVNRIANSDKSLIVKLLVRDVSWHEISQFVFRHYMPRTDRQKTTIEGFADFWARMAADFLNPDSVDEYNAMKHGFRARSGGFGLSIGKQENPNTPAPPDKMKSLGSSKYGATFYKIAPVNSNLGNHHIQAKKISTNWSLDRILQQHQLVYMSINNILTALKIANKVNSEDCRFLRPEGEVDFLSPWTHTTGVTSVNFNVEIDQQHINWLSKTELLDRLKSN